MRWQITNLGHGMKEQSVTFKRSKWIEIMINNFFFLIFHISKDLITSYQILTKYQITKDLITSYQILTEYQITNQQTSHTKYQTPILMKTILS